MSGPSARFPGKVAADGHGRENSVRATLAFPPEGRAHRLPSLTGSTQRSRRRWWVDRIVAAAVRLGGMSVLVWLSLILFYLSSVVWPLLVPAGVRAEQRIAAEAPPVAPRLLAVNTEGTLLFRFDADGGIAIRDARTGALLTKTQLGIGIDAAQRIDPKRDAFALRTRTGDLLLVDQTHLLAPEGAEPRVAGLLPPIPGVNGPFALREFSGQRLLATLSPTAAEAPAQMRLRRWSQPGFLADAGAAWSLRSDQSVALPGPADAVHLSPEGRWLFAINRQDGEVYFLDLRRGSGLNPGSQADLVPVRVETGGALIGDALMAGGDSLLLAGRNGQVVQWFPVRAADGHWALTRVRHFSTAVPLSDAGLVVEPQRRGFAVLGANGELQLFHTTSDRRVARWPTGCGASGNKSGAGPGRLGAVAAGYAPHAEHLWVECADGELVVVGLDNPHPEVSFSALWKKVWYENYPEPDYVWQSSSASSDFEAKLSLTPLMFGTLKGCLYALVFAVPLALGAAVFSAYYLNRAQRAWIKPTVESLEALPTVILGFLAGLWLAPWIQTHLLLVLLLPFCLLLSAGAMVVLGRTCGLRGERWAGRGGLWIALPLLVTVLAAAGLAPVIEAAWFGGDLAGWLEAHAGINYEQRNALVIGIAMGLAIVPTIYAIAEDAVHGVPLHLIQGSLALGATPAQTLARVVLPTASAGMFSAAIIGLGRAAGETMVVLMATGNTPIISASLFDSFRTLSANIAIEMPESAVGSSHFRVLFLAALVLFGLTFAFNTVAELVRERLRRRYRQL